MGVLITFLIGQVIGMLIAALIIRYEIKYGSWGREIDKMVKKAFDEVKRDINK